MRDNVKTLAKFTTEELHAEVARRQDKNKGWGFVIIDDSDAEDGDNPCFGIVSLDEWDKTGSIGDYSLGHRVTLPECFVESQESRYEYRGPGGVNQGKKILKLAGFKLLGTMDI